MRARSRRHHACQLCAHARTRARVQEEFPSAAAKDSLHTDTDAISDMVEAKRNFLHKQLLDRADFFGSRPTSTTPYACMKPVLPSVHPYRCLHVYVSVSMRSCVRLCVRMSACACIHAHVCLCSCLHACPHTRTRAHVCGYACACVCVRACVRV